MIKKDPQIIFSISELNLNFGEQVLFSSAEISVHKGEKISLVGRNGVGKSTFLKIISGEMKLESGNIFYKKQLTKTFLSQELPEDLDMTVFDYVMSGADEVIQYIKQLETVDSASNEAALLDAKITALDGWSLENRVSTVMHKLKIMHKTALLKNLSGGEKRRVSLARALINSPELLILDEPTNHLDIESIIWLENLITSYNGTVIFITHDRYFIDKVATRIVELDSGTFYSYKATYADFLLGKAKRAEVNAEAESKRRSFIRREIDWIKRQPKARGTKSQSRIDRFNKQVARVSNKQETNLDLIIPPSRRLSEKVIEFTNLGFSFTDRTLFENFEFMINPGMKLGLIGPNGVGKTTFLKLITGEYEPVKGNIDRAVSLEINYIDQERCKLNLENTVYDEISEGFEHIKFGNEKITVWTYLKRYLFEDKKIRMPIKYLSGGEKARLLLAKLLKKGGNFLILDEPTNDLDLTSLRALEEAIEHFTGCCLIVSHDRYFLDRVCNGILSFNDNKIKYFIGNYSYFSSKIKERLNKHEESNNNFKTKTNIDRDDSKNKIRKLKWREEKELEGIEEKILIIEERISEIEGIFCKPDFFEKHSSDADSLEIELKSNRTDVDLLYNRWEELEKIKNGEVEVE
ncbi:MAG TPA: ABC-F family ATP-binding cassette domain-containing protein [Victivallales bacterium]|nr:ABC-F family ATP-binding cassette domain-containing protein [Victivallales bacterium]